VKYYIYTGDHYVCESCNTMILAQNLFSFVVVSLCHKSKKYVIVEKSTTTCATRTFKFSVNVP